MTTLKPLRRELVHHGVKGMHWGVRKEQESIGGTGSSVVNIEPGIHKNTAAAALEVSGLIKDRYGYAIQNVKVLDKKHPEYHKDIAAFVENSQFSNGRSEGTVFVNPRDLTSGLKRAEKYGWNAQGTGNVKGLLTHESAHSMFHSTQVITATSSGKQKVTGGDIEARNKALRAAEKAAEQDGRSIWDTSGYARSSGDRAELEAELFSQYHWATDPQRFVQVWGSTLHQELNLDPTPFREVN